MQRQNGSATDADEVALFDAARTGDRKALDAWLRRYEAPIHRFALRMCRDPERAKDVLQESLIAAARTLRNFRGDASPTSWLYTIARSFCSKMRRRRVGEPKGLESIEGAAVDVAEGGKTPEEIVATHRLDRAIAAAIDELEPSQREVLVLRDVEGASAAEVAQILGIGVEAVKSRLHRARTNVREKLAPLLENKGISRSNEPGSDVVHWFSRHVEGDIDAAT